MRHLGLVSLLSLFVTIPALAQDDDDVGRATLAICCGSLNCCNIGGDCYARNEANPDDACLICAPDEENFMFTNICDAGTTAEPDAGATPAPDAGTTPTPDAGTTPAVDAGAVVTPMDAGGGGGTDAGPPDDTDGGCSVGATRGSAVSALALLAALGLLVRRRV